jgi:polar amino acid transport system substrate-binding protein
MKKSRNLQNLSFASSTIKKCTFRTPQGEKLQSRVKTNRVLKAAQLLLILSALTLTSVFVACNSNKNKNSLESIVKRGEIVMYTDANWPPYEYVGASGEVVGMEVDLANAIAKDLGVKLRITNAQFDGFPIAIQKGQADMGLSGITNTAERRETLDFSDPIVTTMQYILKSKADANINCLDDLAGMSIGVQIGTTGDFWVDNHIKNGVLSGSDTSLKQFRSVQEAVLAMKKGDISAIICDRPVADNQASVNPDYETVSAALADGTINSEDVSIAIKKDNTELLNAVNASLKKFKDSGELEKSFLYHVANSAVE